MGYHGIPIYTWNRNDPWFWLEFRPCFGGFNPQNRGQGWPWPRLKADEAGTEPDPERDEILAAQVVDPSTVGVGGLGLGVFRGDGWGRTFPFWLGIYQKVAIYIYIYMQVIYVYIFVFQNVINRFMMSKKISNGSPQKN